jgi:hypothetical protein
MVVDEITLVFILVVFLDLVLIYWLRRRGKPADSDPQVRLFGIYSPVLTWLKYRKLPERKQLKVKKEEIPTVQRTVEGEEPRHLVAALKWIETPTTLTLTLANKLQASMSTWIEILIIAFVALFYAYPLLVSHPGLSLPGNEYQAHVGSAVLFNQWLAGEIDFPLWNPVVGTGRSLIADPFLFFFNPFLSVPMAIFGVINGSKVAVILNFFIAGLGMWLVGRELKFNRITRMWCSLLYMLSGAIPAHLWTGQLQLAFALGWLPWAFAGILWTIKRSSLVSLLLACLTQALFFFTGNLYYQLYAFFCFLILGISFVIDWGQLRLKRGIIHRILLMGVISLGLISIQFLPEFASHSDVQNLGGFLDEETEYSGSQLPEHAILNYFVSDLEYYKDPILDKIPYPQESYRYIGIMPFLLLLFLVPTIKRGNRKEIIVFGLCFLLMLAWTDIRYSFVKTLYRSIPLLDQFRWPGRALSVGGFFLILISSYCLNYLWEWLQSNISIDKKGLVDGLSRGTSLLYSISLILLVIGLFLSTRHVYLKNQDLIYLEKTSEPEIKVALAWLRNNDPNPFSIYSSHTIATKSTLDLYKYHLRSPTIVDGWIPATTTLTLGSLELNSLQPKYWLTWAWDEIDHSNHDSVYMIGPLQIWSNPNTYPYAFLMPIVPLLSGNPVLPNTVQPVTDVQRGGCNRVVVEAEPSQESVLVVSESWFSGWKVSIDQKPAELTSVSNLLAVQISPGRHTVEFEYSPFSFKIGAFITISTLLFIVLAFIREGLKVYLKRYTQDH